MEGPVADLDLRSASRSPHLSQKAFPQSILQCPFLWLPRTDRIGPSAGKLGGNLKNQYWLLREGALPKAN